MQLHLLPFAFELHCHSQLACTVCPPAPLDLHRARAAAAACTGSLQCARHRSQTIASTTCSAVCSYGLIQPLLCISCTNTSSQKQFQAREVCQICCHATGDQGIYTLIACSLTCCMHVFSSNHLRKSALHCVGSTASCRLVCLFVYQGASLIRNSLCPLLTVIVGHILETEKKKGKLSRLGLRKAQAPQNYSVLLNMTPEQIIGPILKWSLLAWTCIYPC